MTKNATASILFKTGKTSYEVNTGKRYAYQAKAGEFYRIVTEADGKLLRNVIAKRRGDDLHLEYADGTVVTLKNYYEVCKSAASCKVTLPSDAGAGYVPGMDLAPGVALGDGYTMVYAHGEPITMLGMAPANSPMSAALRELNGANITYIPSSDTGMEWVWGGVGLAGVGLSGGGSAAAAAVVTSNFVNITVLAGPVVDGNGLVVDLYRGDGVTLIGTGKLNADGSFSFDVGSYTGVVIAKVLDNDAGYDYVDEASGSYADLSVNLMAIGVAQTGVTKINVNLLTTVAASKAGVVYAGASSADITAGMVVENNQAVASAFGLSDLQGTDIITTVDVNGASNPAYDPQTLTAEMQYGAVLAALSGMDAAEGNTQQGTLETIVNGLNITGSKGSLTSTALDLLIVGARAASGNVSGADDTGLTSVVSALTQTVSASVSIDRVATDDIINTTEHTITITGTTVEGATVELSFGGVSHVATVNETTVNGTTWSYTLSVEDVSAMGQGGETLVATATLLGSGGTATATRTVAVDTPDDTTAPTTTAQVTGIEDDVGVVTGIVASGGVTDDTSVSVSGTLGGATEGASLEEGGSVLIYDGLTYLGDATVTVDEGGQSTWSYTDTRTLANAQVLSYTARVSDAAGNQSEAGAAYTATLDTTALVIELSAIAAGEGGFVINGQCADDYSGLSVSSAGDVNGDGLADLVVGACRSDQGAGHSAGRSYVVFGTTDTSPIELSAVANGTGGFVINGQCADDSSGISVSSAGDVSGDGLADLIVGAYRSDPGGVTDAGRSYVVFGTTATSAIDLSAVANGTGGFVINGQCANDFSGISVSSAGDVNGDGLADLIVGAVLASPNFGSATGRSYVVFGTSETTPIDLSAVANGTGGFVINGQCAGDQSGWSVSSAGDVNGDGLADLVVGARYSNPRAGSNAGSNAGRSYVVFGTTGSTPIELSAVADGTGGFVINGQCVYDRSGQSVASARDVNGDGLADLIVGAHLGDPGARSNAGRSYVIFGSTTGAFKHTSVDQLGDSSPNILSGTANGQTLAGGAGDDILGGLGGADVLLGGAGDDVLWVNDGNIAALEADFGSGDNSTQLARMDGGSGLDTLKLDGAGLTLDLTAIANQGGSTPGSSSRIESIERIDLTGSGANTLFLSPADVLDMAGMNSFNNANGWGDVTYDLAAGGANGANPEQRHQVVIDGNAGDVVNSSGWGASAGTVTHNGQTYDVYNQGQHAQLLIHTDITAFVV